jgi:hypothetical protein
MMIFMKDDHSPAPGRSIGEHTNRLTMWMAFIFAIFIALLAIGFWIGRSTAGG